MPKPEDPPKKLDPGEIQVRTMRAEDLETVIKIDSQNFGWERKEYLNRMVQRGINDPSQHICLVAEAEGIVAGFACASLFYGEFGLEEPSATFDVIAVNRELMRKNVGSVLMDHLREQLTRLGMKRLRVEVAIDQYDLMSFFRTVGFTMSPRVCMELEIKKES